MKTEIKVVNRTIIRELKGKMLLDLVKEHKDQCNISHCGVSTYFFLEVFEKIVGRKAEDWEFRHFI